MHVKKNDNVIVITGKDKGKKGVITRVIPSDYKVIVEGLNVMKRHQRSRLRDKKGEMVDVAMPIHASNVKKVK
jgi:large subunit ribosomal protein L24